MKKMHILFAMLAMLSMVLSINEARIRKTASSVELPQFAQELYDSDEHYGSVFGQGKIVDVEIEISEDDLTDIFQNPLLEKYHIANVTINGNKATNVGFKTKGSGSLTAIAQTTSTRFGFKINTEEYVDGKTLNGLTEFVLNPSFADASYMREFLTYAATAELGGITPFMSFAKLSINGRQHGLYLIIEAYDNSFVERIAKTDYTLLYKASDDPCSLAAGSGTTGFSTKYGEDDEMCSIKNLIDQLNSLGAEHTISSLLDVSSVLKSIAVNTVMGNYDSYSGSKSHNYYLLYDGGIFTYVPWDYNMSIGAAPNDGGRILNVDIFNPFFEVESNMRPLFSVLLKNEEYRKEYIGYIEQLLEFTADFSKKTDEIHRCIDYFVKTDLTAFFSHAEFEKEIEAINSYIAARSEIIKNRLEG